MNKKKIIEDLSNRTQFRRRDCQLILEEFMDIVGTELSQGGKVVFQGFGTFHRWDQAERSGRNPRTGEEAIIHRRTSVKFKPGVGLLKQVNG